MDVCASYCMKQMNTDGGEKSRRYQIPDGRVEMEQRQPTLMEEKLPGQQGRAGIDVRFVGKEGIFAGSQGGMIYRTHRTSTWQGMGEDVEKVQAFAAHHTWALP